MSERADRDRKFQTKPCWSWSGAERLNFPEQTKGLAQLVAMLPTKGSSDNQILAFLVELRARFQRWLHQDEFGPTRRQQTAAPRAFKKSLQKLQRQLARGARSQRDQLDATLRNGDGRSSLTLERIYEAASDLERYLQISESPNRERDWAIKMQVCAGITIAQSQSLDTNTESEIFLIAIRDKFDLLQTCAPDSGLAGAKQWLNAYRNVVDKKLCELNEGGGA
jgi:hypothetical protein